MNKDIVEGHWKQMRGHIKEWWGKLTNDDLDKINGQCDRLVGMIQQKYGYTKAQAEQELDRHLSDYESYAGASTSMSHRYPENSAHTATHLQKVLPVSTLIGSRVINPAGDDLGQIEDMAIDMASGRIAYAVLSFGGFLGFGSKYFALPWEALRLSSAEEAFILHVDRAVLEKAPGFDKDHWPEMADRQWGAGIYNHYGYRPYWEE
jgi:uncharacterized protein YjbJ (UPF0337 family)/sporulation protein YlmC with PRC-barrel domain